MDLSVFFAGTGGSIPTAGRGLPALLVRRGGERLLFDCGEGTQRQLVRSVGLAELDAVFLTHYHADHWLGLPGMLKTFDLRGRERPLAIYGPPGLREIVAFGLRTAGGVRYKLELVEQLICLAEEVGANLAQYALAWTLTNPAVTAPIIGPRVMEQLEDNLGALDVTIPPEHLERIDQMVPPGTDL